MYNAIIIGAGQIGALYDNPASNSILTHAHALNHSGNFDLLGFVDINLEKAKTASKLWGGQVYSSIEEALLNNKIDIAVICVPDAFHYKVIQQIYKHKDKIKLILMEKPITNSLEEAQLLIDEYKDIDILVNYSRRFYDIITEIKENIQEGNFGELMAGTAYYGKGVTHNGSHLIDLLIYFFEKVSVYKKLNDLFDYYDNDPSVNAILKIHNVNFVLHAVSCKKVTIFEADFLFEKARIVIDGDTVKLYEVSCSQIYSGEQNYVLRKEIMLDPSEPMLNCYKHITEVLNKKVRPCCTAKDGYNCLKICKKLLDG